MMLASDVLGLTGSLLLVVAPARDQWARWQSFRTERDSIGSVWPAAKRVLARGWEVYRNSFSGWESLSVLAGGTMLALSFGLKIFGL